MEAYNVYVMSASDLTEYVQQLRLDGDGLADARGREVIGKVLNLVEAVVAEEPPPPRRKSTPTGDHSPTQG